jgi:type I restriction enzyme S subunit
VKAGWRERRLSEVLEIQNGYAFDSKQFRPDGEMPLIRIRDLKSGVRTETNYSGEYDERYRVRAGDFLIGMDGEFGCYEWRGPDALLNQRVCRLANFAPDIDARYLFYGINSHLKAIEEVTGFTTVKHLSSKQIASIKFLFPPLEEQRRIVAVLDKAFAAIATATANAEKNLANSRELFGAIFGQTLVEPGPGWSVVEIGSIADLISGQHIDASDYNNQRLGIGYLTGPSDFGERCPIVTKWTEHPKRTALRGDILITVKGSGVGSVNVMDESELAISRQLMAVRVNSTDPELVYYALEAGFEHFQALATGAAIPGISRSDVLGFKIALPPKLELPSFMERLHDIRASSGKLAESYRQQISCLAALKQSLLHRAFTGELTADMPETIAA